MKRILGLWQILRRNFNKFHLFLHLFEMNLQIFDFKVFVSFCVLRILIMAIYTAIGSVLANRLSEIEDWNVLLLEAGGDGSEIYDIPVLAANLQLTQIDWKYKTEPNKNFCRGN